MSIWRYSRTASEGESFGSNSGFVEPSSMITRSRSPKGRFVPLTTGAARAADVSGRKNPMRGFKGYAWVRFRVGRKRSVPGEKGLSGVANASFGFYTVWFVHLGRRYGIISYLSRRKRPAGARAIARACELHEPAVRVWCESARSLGIIDREGDGYRMPPISGALFADADDVRFLGGQFSYLALRSLDFEAFDALFRRGRVDASGSHHLREASEEATRWDHTSFVKFLLPRAPGLASRLRAGARALDVGCGTGGGGPPAARAVPQAPLPGGDPGRPAVRPPPHNRPDG